MTRYDARQVLENIELLIEGSSPVSLPNPRLSDGEDLPPRPSTDSGDEADADEEIAVWSALGEWARSGLEPPGTPSESGRKERRSGERQDLHSSLRALSLSILPALRAAQQVDKVPEGTRYGLFKKIFMRLFRLVSGRQASFNYLSISALEVLAQHIDRVHLRVHRLEEAQRQSISALFHLRHLQQKIRADLTDVSVRLEGVQLTVDMTETLLTEEFGSLRAALNKSLERIGEDITSLESRLANASQSSLDMVKSVWAGIEERDEKLIRVVQMESQARDIETRLVALSEQVNAQVELFERLQTTLRSAGEAELAPAEPGQGELSTETLKGSTAAPKREFRIPESPLESAIEELKELQIDSAYLRFQRQFRGDAASLADRQSHYVELIRDRMGKESATAGKRRLLDLACGDGVFLRFWSEFSDWEARGVDINTAMVHLAREAGLEIDQADAFDYLESGPEKAWDVITSFQFIEHLDKGELVRLLRDCKRALKPGGLLLFETLNPHTLMAHKWFHLDLTHKRLIFPEVAALLMESIGLRVLEYRSISEVHESERLKLLGDARLQANFDRLNELLFGKQDYYILAQRP